MQQNRKRGYAYRLVGVVVCLAFVVGCGGRAASVTGVVSVDGVPLDRGSVSFAPTTGGQMAVGKIESDGSYELMTNRDNGLDTGSYRVSIVSREMVEGEQGAPPMQGKYLAPRRYSNPSTSGLEFMVESGSNVIDLNLESPAEPPRRRNARRRSL